MCVCFGRCVCVHGSCRQEVGVHSPRVRCQPACIVHTPFNRLMCHQAPGRFLRPHPMCVHTPTDTASQALFPNRLTSSPCVHGSLYPPPSPAPRSSPLALCLLLRRPDAVYCPPPSNLSASPTCQVVCMLSNPTPPPPHTRPWLHVFCPAGLMLSAAATYAPKNIRVNCVAPGLTRTPLADRITSNPAALKASEGMHALKRWVQECVLCMCM